MHRVLDEIDAGYRPMVVGDGINDSLALKAGAVGIAMGAQGTDVALASADLVLMTSDLRRLGTAIRLSRRCRRTIHVNVAIGLGWTVVLVGAGRRRRAGRRRAPSSPRCCTIFRPSWAWATPAACCCSTRRIRQRHRHQARLRNCHDS